MGIWQIFDKSLIGLDIGVSGIKAVELSPGKTRRLMAYNRIPLPFNCISPDGEIKNRDVVISALRRLFDNKEFTTRKVATAGFGNSIITKKIQVDRMKLEDLREQIYWEAEQYIPFDVNDVNLDFAILSSNTTAANKMDVLLVAAKKDYVQSLTQTLEAADLTVETIDTQAFALGNSFEFNYAHAIEASSGSFMLLDFGAGSTKVSLFEQDKTTFNRDLRQCGLSCSLMLSERLSVSLDEAEKLKTTDAANPSVAAILDEFNNLVTDEVARTIEFALAQSSESSLDGIFVCGGASRTEGLLGVLGKKLSAPVKPLNPVQNIAGSGRRMNATAIKEMMYMGTVAIGLGLRAGGGG